jgi:hypothetical protein
MTRLVWFFAWVAVAIWSVVAFSAYGLLDLFGGLLARNADSLASDPGTVEWLFWVTNGLKKLGLAAILLVWGLVSLAMLAVPWTLSRLARRAAAPPPRDARFVELPPDQYRVVGAPRPPEPTPGRIVEPPHR